MDVIRAQQIVDSPDQIPVYYQNKQIWIQRVDQEEKKAHIHPLKEEGSQQSVPVSELSERMQ
ncbi:H-type small acid-soluble spore protein [Mechercharimyces sp. CAU 1602]|uniref:H-type small acid-soluble spore protein n=1 Tax=Mechercharimyces sp. CAU 1602 TaxID=2973933 RepID=UPI00216301AC|nr:H-type small acid-soluble spore protein [Mechercharimyces sp. CAU 1602]MCS1350021.1 H-type small acid-soluble spore protein [Mechercharimyces sp. CAU 1602]